MQQTDYNTNAPAPPPGVYNAPQPQPNQDGKGKMSTGAKVAIGLGIGTAVLLVLGALAMLFLLRSCDAHFFGSEEPNDTKEVKAFVHVSHVTERDLETFDILRTGFEGFYLDKSENGLVKGGVIDGERPAYQDRKQRHAEAAAYVDAFRDKLEAGSWPLDDPVFYGPDHESSPQLWVRMAELAETYIEKETGEDWGIISFSYPYADIEWDYVVPMKEKHGGSDELITSLVCNSGPDAGLCVDVCYRRWEYPARMYSNYGERLATLQKRKEQEALVWESELIDGRQYAMDGLYQRIYVWSPGEVDSLRDSDNFTRTLIELSEATGMEGLELVLLAPDAPAFRWREFPSMSNSLGESEVVPARDVPKAILMDMCKADSFKFAPADVLFEQTMSADAEVGALRGSLASIEDDQFYDWRSTRELEADAELSSFVAKQLGLAEGQAIALSGMDNSGSHLINVIVPRGALAETPDSVDEGIRDLQKALWQRTFAEPEEEDLYTIHLTLYVIDADGLTGSDGATTFADLHAAVMADTQAISSYNAIYILRASLSSYAYDDEVENVADGWATDYGIDLDGPLTESRAWYLASAEEN
ncbi:MAG: hypothetical protein IJ113_05890 [Eggerthellaceae bacterium]|nr:hypothetical protein [Eggerthellaceae bacterium]